VKKAKLIIATERVFVIRKRGAPHRARCEACGKEVDFVAADEAAVLARVSSRAIYRSVEDGNLHFIETAEGSLGICLNSLSNSRLGTEGTELATNSRSKGDDHEYQE